MFLRKSEEVKKINTLNKPHNGDKKGHFDDPNNIIEIKGVKKSFINGELITDVLKGIDLSIKKGEFVVILGPSGSGKTTLMNIISGLDRATEGEVNVVDSNLISLTDDELTVFRRKNIAYVFQQYGLLPNLKVYENIQIGAFLAHSNEKERKKLAKKISRRNTMVFSNYSMFWNNYFNITFNKLDPLLNYILIDSINRFYFFNINNLPNINNFNSNNLISVEQAMEMFNISDLRNKFPSQLSGGQQQRVSIARAICKQSNILFADEPTGAVDEEMSDIILDSFKYINKKFGTTIVIVTHNPQIANLATKVIYFRNGYIDHIIDNNKN